MSKEQILSFSVHTLTIKGSSFSIDTFSKIQEKDSETVTSTFNDGSKEVLTTRKIEKYIQDDRFIMLYFLEGDKYPYSDTVINKENNEVANPRPIDQIELDSQFFAIADIKTQKLYLYTSKKKGLLIKFLKRKLEGEIVIKPVISEQEFISSISEIDKLSFSLTPSIFNANSAETLTKALVESTYGFEAEELKVELTYHHKKISDKIRGSINNLFRFREDYKNITIIGRNEQVDELESILNLDGIINKLNIKCEPDAITGKFSPINLFNCAIAYITK